MSCCKNNLGEFPHNADINTGLLAAQEGLYTLLLSGVSGTKYPKTVELEAGADIIIERPFNEDFIYDLEIIQPDGTKVSVDGCETFTFKTYISYSTPCNDDQSTDTNHLEDSDDAGAVVYE